MWVLLMPRRFGGSNHASGHNDRSRYCEVGISGAWHRRGRQGAHPSALQLPTDEHLAFRVDAMHLKYRLRNIETDRCDRLHDWTLRIVGASTAPTFMALMCRWRSRPQHHKR